MFSPAADYDDSEREKEVLSTLIKRFVVDKEDKNQPSWGKFIGKNSREPKDDYLELNRLKQLYPGFILTNKNALLGQDLTDAVKQSFLNSVDKDWRTKEGGTAKKGRRTKNRRKNKKTKKMLK